MKLLPTFPNICTFTMVLKINISFFVIIIVWTLFSETASAQQKTIIDVKGTIVSDRKYIAEKIKVPIPRTDENPASPVNNNKLFKPKGCEIQCNNMTGYFIEIYLDGVYKGTVAPWSEIWVVSDSGYRSLYCITTGKTKEWSITGNCKEENYIWNLK